jgi:hypothetical protein
MVWTTLWQMVRTRSGKGVYDDVPKSSTRHCGAFRLPVPPPNPLTPPVSLHQLLASQKAIMQRLAEIDERQSRHSQQHQQPQESSYLNFLTAHPLEFVETMDPLEANHWLHMTESKFGLLRCSELQNTLFAAQQFHGSTSDWWVLYTTTTQNNYQVSWNEFCTTFCERHLPAGTMHRKLWEFLDLQQGTDNVYEYIKRFNYLAQYVLIMWIPMRRRQNCSKKDWASCFRIA